MDSINVDEVDAKPKRPGLRRETSTPGAPPPPSQPPPAPPPSDPTDSLSLPQLRQLVNQFPKSEATPYAFQYSEAEDFEPEIDEWFHYSELDQDRQYLLASSESFEARWKLYCDGAGISDDIKWIAVDDGRRQEFALALIDDLDHVDYEPRSEALSCVYYILMGVWSTTSGLDSAQSTTQDDSQTEIEHSNVVQTEWMHRGATLLQRCSVMPHIHKRLVKASVASDTIRTSSNGEEPEGTFGENEYQELSLCLSCFYLLVESARARSDTSVGQAIRHSIASLQPNFLVFLVGMISRLRWDETYNIPLMHALQLFWKSVLLLFGDVSEHLEKAKSILQPQSNPASTEVFRPTITASPLDYHAFRQEITSKYPAYNPPPNIIPLELEQKSMLPPLTNHSRNELARMDNGAFPGAARRDSIFHQQVYIATPAPSPPPSPVGPGGKAGKKQNYQTNQNFPFLYPPLDGTSDKIGGKGSTFDQDTMVGMKWEGSDVPLSIIEAGELFASRMRMTRAMRQLWAERDLFLEYERGWKGDMRDEVRNGQTTKNEEEKCLEGLDDSDLRSRMVAVDDFFHQVLPDLQSLVIVMMKVMLTNVQDIAVRNGGMQDLNQSGGLNRTKSNSNMAQTQALPVPPPPPRPNDMMLEDLDNVRSREISQKAIAGALFLLLKWFKISHVLKFEYLTQLLLDSNYVQLTLKYFAHQNLEDLVAFKYDREDLNVWHYCHMHSDHPPLSPTSPNQQSEASDGDDAVPPPIARHRRSPTANTGGPTAPELLDDSPEIQQSPEQGRPSVDELGNPLGAVPQTPITIFSFRQFQTSIHLLRVLQKLTRGKAHRILFLVQFKSSQILRRVLRVPDPTLRLYVLKLFKSQVPYCGRKWRQNNMRVITAIYLHCRPELRDEWLAGMHDANVEGEVDEAVPLEWALRGLTFWWQKRRYPDVTRKGKKGTEPITDEGEDDLHDIDDDERDFFQKELDALGWGLAGTRLVDEGDEVMFGEEAGSANGVYPAMNTEAAGPAAPNGLPTANSTSENRAPQTPTPQPQWVVADAAALDNWQNS